MNGQVIGILVVLSVILLIVFLEYKSKKIRDSLPKPIRTKILDGGSDGSKAGGVGRAIVGNVVAGPVGAVVGATTAGHKNKGFTMFKVWYDDGRVEVEKIFHNNRKYREYLELLEDE